MTFARRRLSLRSHPLHRRSYTWSAVGPATRNVTPRRERNSESHARPAIFRRSWLRPRRRARPSPPSSRQVVRIRPPGRHLGRDPGAFAPVHTQLLDSAGRAVAPVSAMSGRARTPFGRMQQQVDGEGACAGGKQDGRALRRPTCSSLDACSSPYRRLPHRPDCCSERCRHSRAVWRDAGNASWLPAARLSRGSGTGVITFWLRDRLNGHVDARPR
jgi:hypothetical protein